MKAPVRAPHGATFLSLSALSLSALVGSLACSSSPHEPPATPAASEPAPEVATPPASSEDSQVQAEPTQDDAAARAAAEQLAQDRANMQAEAERELARWTPELRQQARSLAEKSYPDLKTALGAMLSSPHRTPGHAERDVHRHPAETLEFFGLKPDMTVLEYGPGGGWYTELLAPILAARGKLLVTTTDPAGPPESRATFYAERLDHFLKKSPELFGKVERTVFDPAAPQLGLNESVDLVLVIRGLHGWVRDGKEDVWLQQIHAALKPGGVLGIVQHRGAPDSDPKASAPDGYLPEAWVIERVQALGFELAEKSEINANPKDTRDHDGGVWALPPTLRHGEQDRDKYQTIGESDRMTLRFVKTSR